MKSNIINFEKERVLVSCNSIDESLVPSPVLTKFFRIESVPFIYDQIFDTPQLSNADVNEINKQTYSFVRSYISEYFEDYYYNESTNPNPIGWVYLESIETDFLTTFDSVSRIFKYSVVNNCRIVFYENISV
jgi:hypothetical protein